MGKRDHEYEDPEEKERRKASKKAEKVCGCLQKICIYTDIIRMDVIDCEIVGIQ